MMARRVAGRTRRLYLCLKSVRIFSKTFTTFFSWLEFPSHSYNDILFSQKFQKGIFMKEAGDPPIEETRLLLKVHNFKVCVDLLRKMTDYYQLRELSDYLFD